GQLIIRQDDPATRGLHMVRVGFVKVSRREGPGERVLSYIGPGGYFGEIGLLSDEPEIRAVLPPGVRSASCTALAHVELVRLRAETFQGLLRRYPGELRRPIVAEALNRLAQARMAGAADPDASLRGECLRQGLMNAQSLRWGDHRRRQRHFRGARLGRR